jgi:hypothetical protein
MLHRVYYLPELYCQLFFPKSDRVELDNLLLILDIYALLVQSHLIQIVTQRLTDPLKNLPHIAVHRASDLLAHLLNQIVVASVLLDLLG